MVVSPDEGSIKRALGHAKRLQAPLAIVDKRRASADETKQENIIGSPVKDKICLMFDDMISTASSIVRRGQGDSRSSAPARFTWPPRTACCAARPSNGIESAPIQSLVITDTIPLSPQKMLPKIKVLSVAPLLGEAIKRIHRNESVSGLFV